MNFKQEEFKKNRLLQMIKHNSRFGNKDGYVKVYPNNSLNHEESKLRIAYKLKKQGFYVLSEVEFNNGQRADLVAIKEGKGWIIEVVSSETKESIDNKLNTYPIEFEIRIINCQDFSLDEFEL